MLTRAAITEVVERGLAEDAPWGDITSEHLIPAGTTARAELVAREPGVFSGGQVFAATFAAADPAVAVELVRADGDRFEAGDTLAVVTGPARAVLTGERVALNLTQRMCGIATLTARYVAAVEQTVARVEQAANLPPGTITRTRVADTRKTTPGLRVLEKHAVLSGGGHNHRHSLSDAVMAKDNHLALLTADGTDLAGALRQLRRRLPHTVHLEVEVDRLDQIEAVLAGGADTVLLDNFSVDDLVSGVAIIDGRATVEASGGVSLETVGDIAATGVDVISVGALTHSARNLDLGLDIGLGHRPGTGTG
ncbi:MULTISPECIES: carboxylating nicotinate-nucleotide diphosphorylase [Kocuria]|uniref:Nicotinate-nucleotide pyrophosphorylase [carboxylating] n=1 Tax=Kocuria rosea subsp. polaris TaxID=136273 RepID=A0A0W8IN51_KOCRO|nr:carboxylating nicotinate-nucleotide diphosphorylase [Kocuria polaris]KUG61322.1 nicotinate-nucleotide pyrophosphorylase [Kocuria polaris]